MSKTSSPVVLPAVAAAPIKYALAEFARPQHGSALFSHTMAFLQLSGLTEGKAFPKAQATRILGPTAVKYHTKKGNFSQSEKGLSLTPDGFVTFLQRDNLGKLDAEAFAGFVAVMTTGAVDPRANVKTEAARVALK